MGTTSRSRAKHHRSIGIVLACLSLAAASPAAAVVPDKGPVVGDAPAAPTYRMAPNEPRTTSPIDAVASATAPARSAPNADGIDWAIAASAALALVTLAGTALVLTRRRRGPHPVA